MTIIDRFRKATLSQWLVWSVWAAMSVALLGFVDRFGIDVPYLDDWNIVPAATGSQPVTAEWLWSQHNEHRIPLPRLLLLGLLKISGGDFRSGMYFNAVLLIGMSFAVLQVAATLRGRAAATDIFIPLLFLSWGHFDNLLWCWQAGLMSSVTLAMLVIVAVCLPGGRVDVKAALLTAAGCLLPLTGASGLAFALPMIPLLLVAVKNLRQEHRTARVILLAGALMTGLESGLYFVNYHKADIPPPPDNFSVFRSAFEFLSVSFGPPWNLGFESVHSVFPGGLFWLLGCTALISMLIGIDCAIRDSHRPGAWTRGWGLCAVICGSLILAAGVAWGRAGFGPGQAMMARYYALGLPGLTAAYLATLLNPGSPTARGTAYMLLAASVLAAWPNADEGLALGRLRHDTRTAPFARDLEAGVPPMILADHYTRYPVALYPRQHEKDMASEIRMLHDAGIGPFRLAVDDPRYQIVPIDRANSTELESGLFVLRQPTKTYAIAVNYRYIPQTPQLALATFRLSWTADTSDAGGTVQQYECTLLEDGKSDHVLVWVDGPVGKIHISPNDGPCNFQLTSIQLLVPAD